MVIKLEFPNQSFRWKFSTKKIVRNQKNTGKKVFVQIGPVSRLLLKLLQIRQNTTCSVRTRKDWLIIAILTNGVICCHFSHFPCNDRPEIIPSWICNHIWGASAPHKWFQVNILYKNNPLDTWFWCHTMIHPLLLVDNV